MREETPLSQPRSDPFHPSCGSEEFRVVTPVLEFLEALSFPRLEGAVSYNVLRRLSWPAAIARREYSRDPSVAEEGPKANLLGSNLYRE